MTSGMSQFDLTLHMMETSSGLECSFEYQTSLFESSSIVRLVHHFINLCEAILESPDEQISKIDYLSEEEKKTLLVDFNQTEVSYPSGSLYP